MTSVGDIRAGRAYVEIGTNARPLETGLRGALARVRAFAARAEAFGGSISMFGSLGGVLAGGGAAGALVLLGKRFADAGAAQAKFMQQTELSREQLGGLRKAALDVDVDDKSLFGMLTKLQRNIADPSKEVLETFDKIGVQAQELQSMNVGQVLGLVANRLPQRIEDPDARVEAASTLFGKGGEQMLAVLDGGTPKLNEAAAKAQKLGMVPSEESAKAAKALDDALDDLSASAEGLKTALGTALAPALEAVVKWLTEAATKVAEWVKENPRWVAVLGAAAVGIAGVSTALIALGAAFKGARLAGSAFMGVLETLRKLGGFGGGSVVSTATPPVAGGATSGAAGAAGGAAATAARGAARGALPTVIGRVLLPVGATLLAIELADALNPAAAELERLRQQDATREQREKQFTGMPSEAERQKVLERAHVTPGGPQNDPEVQRIAAMQRLNERGQLRDWMSESTRELLIRSEIEVARRQGIAAKIAGGVFDEPATTSMPGDLARKAEREKAEKERAKAVEENERLARTTTLSRAQVGAMRSVATAEKVDFDGVSDALAGLYTTKVQMSIGETPEQVAEAFARIGLRESQVREMDMGQLVSAIASRLPAIEDEEARKATALDLFGSNGLDTLRVLERGPEGLSEAVRDAVRDGFLSRDQAGSGAAFTADGGEWEDVVTEQRQERIAKVDRDIERETRDVTRAMSDRMARRQQDGGAITTFSGAAAAQLSIGSDLGTTAEEQLAELENIADKMERLVELNKDRQQAAWGA